MGAKTLQIVQSSAHPIEADLCIYIVVDDDDDNDYGDTVDDDDDFDLIPANRSKPLHVYDNFHKEAKWEFGEYQMTLMKV